MFKLPMAGRHEWEAWTKDIRLQLNEQLKCLDMRMEAQVAFAAELQDFYRKKAEMELDHSKNLDKLATQMKNKEHKHKREWLLFSLSDLYQQLMNETKSLSKDYSALSEVYSVHLVGHLNQMMEDIQRIYKRCREIGYEIHEEILRVLNELHATMKTYQTYQAESKQAETKLCVAERQRSKLEMANADSRLHQKLVRSKKYKLVEKEINKRKSKCQEAKLKALKARNEYLLCLEASNTTIHKYFVDDLSDLIDCMDFGFHNCLTRALHMHLSAEEGRRFSLKSSADMLGATVNSLDSRGDKQKFLESYNTAFMIPRKFEFEGHEHENTEPELQKLLRTEMEQRLQQLQSRVTTLRIESEEVYKTLETTEKSLLEMQTTKDDCTKYFGENAASTSKPPETLQIKLRADKQETEEFYLTKFREYLLATSKIARLEAKQDFIKEHLLDSNDSMTVPTAAMIRQKTRRKIGRLQINQQTKLFGGSLEEYLDSTKEEIPLIIKSCIRIINLYGMHHQGIFRVSGSQVEIYKFKESFERGEDPLAYITDASDINSVAGLLKLYLRELREPLFPLIYFEKLIDISKNNSPNDIIIKLKELISTLPKSIIIVLRYLFSFLNHLSDYADENMMDANNLAVCFGPSIINIPDNYDPVISQNCINIVIKYIIIYAEEIFPEKLDGIKYEKHFTEDLDDVETEESTLGTEEPDSSNYSEEEIDVSIEELINYQNFTQLDPRSSKSSSDLPQPEPCCSKETNTEIPLRLARVSTLYCSNNISSTSRSLKVDGVLQVKPEHRVEYIEDDGGNASLDQQSVVTVDLSSPRGYHEKRNNHETSTTITPNNESQQELQATTNFSVNRELWQRRARVRDSQKNSLSTTQTQLMPPTAKPSSYSRVSQEFREMRQKHTPDLVMDLPLLTQDSVGRKSTSSSSLSYAQTAGRCGLPADEETMPSSLLVPQQQTLPSRTEATSPSGGPESPDMSTAAERFAKQNQCTLKKNTKIVNLCTGENAVGSSKLKQIETTEHEESSAVIDTENGNQMTVDSGGSRGSDLIRAGRSDDFIVLPASTPKIVAKFTDMHLTGGSQMMSFKPQIKVKPTILRKPVLPYPRMSPELARKQDGA
ncbi:SLIT-ROBO Rho GTPase-activating protein 1-like isoform X2 [Linepithema humile]|uniref:SLIT-ROBO Rho GTPase-activating protein 1-like isoform X2 n=1 Tax=Linepithema humile TaxID=83485 RepID=UPI00351EA1D7